MPGEGGRESERERERVREKKRERDRAHARGRESPRESALAPPFIYVFFPPPGPALCKLGLARSAVCSA